MREFGTLPKLAWNNKMKIYKSKSNNEEKELKLELDYLLSLTTQERFQMMFEKSRIINEMLIRNGHKKSIEKIKRKVAIETQSNSNFLIIIVHCKKGIFR